MFFLSLYFFIAKTVYRKVQDSNIHDLVIKSPKAMNLVALNNNLNQH